MLTTREIEQRLADAIAAESELGSPVDELVRRLFAIVPGCPSESTDGVIFQYSEISAGTAVGVGIVIMIDQRVEPIRVRFTLGNSENPLASGRVLLGDATQTRSYGSREHAKLEKAIIAYHDVEVQWSMLFEREGDGWRFERPAG